MYFLSRQASTHTQIKQQVIFGERWNPINSVHVYWLLIV